MNAYVIGADVLGWGMMPVAATPEQLSKLDRALTPEEYARVSAWQSGQADAMLATERAKGGPRSETVAVTSQGAVIRAPAPSPRKFPWQIIIAVVGGVLILTLGGVLVFKPSHTARHA